MCLPFIYFLSSGCSQASFLLGFFQINCCSSCYLAEYSYDQLKQCNLSVPLLCLIVFSPIQTTKNCTKQYLFDIIFSQLSKLVCSVSQKYPLVIFSVSDLLLGLSGVPNLYFIGLLYTLIFFPHVFYTVIVNSIF